VDTGSSDCYIDGRFADKRSLNVRRAVEVAPAETSVRIRMPFQGRCVTQLLVENNEKATQWRI